MRPVFEVARTVIEVAYSHWKLVKKNTRCPTKLQQKRLMKSNSLS